MRIRVFTLLLIALPVAAQSPRVSVDPRVELMSIIFRLAGNSEYNQCRVPAYNAAIDRWFAPFKDHEAVQVARHLREHNGVSHDAVMSMAIHVKDIETLAERIPFDSKESRLDHRWRGAKARRSSRPRGALWRKRSFRNFSILNPLSTRALPATCAR